MCVYQCIHVCENWVLLQGEYRIRKGAVDRVLITGLFIIKDWIIHLTNHCFLGKFSVKLKGS